MERKIGEVFDCNGVKLCVKEDIEICKGCYFYENNIACSHYSGDTGECDCIGRIDHKGVIFEEVKDMEERIIKLTLEKAKEFYKKGGEFKDLALSAYTEEELKEVVLPKTWKEFCDNYPIKPGEFFIDLSCGIVESDDGKRHEDVDKSVLPNKQAAEAHLAFMQLHQLRDCYRQGWEPNYSDTSLKYSVTIVAGGLTIIRSVNVRHFLSFQTEEVAMKFLGNFGNLIFVASDLIG